MKKGDKVYYCEVVPNCDIYEVLELTIRTVEDGWCVGVDEKSKQAQLFTENMLDKYVFHHRVDAVEALKKFTEAGKV